MKYAFANANRKIKGTVIGPAYSEKIETTTSVADNLSLRTIPSSTEMPVIREILYCKKLAKVLQGLECDIVNLNSHLQVSALPVIMVASRRKLPLVVTIHGVYSKTNFIVDTLQKAYLHTFCRVLWNKAKAIVCLTQSDADEIVSYGCPRHKIVVIPNWVNVELFRPSEEKRESQILWVGRFVPPKGLGFLVKAAKIVTSQFP